MRGERGAVYVEFLIAFLPTFILFFGICEVALLYVAKLQVTRATTTAARAAMVVLPDHPDFYGDEKPPVNEYDGKRKELIKAAAAIPLLSTLMPWRVSVEVTPERFADNPETDLKVTVKYRYRCVMPIMRRWVCTPPEGIKGWIIERAVPDLYNNYFLELTDTVTVANHGAKYDYDKGLTGN